MSPNPKPSAPADPKPPVDEKPPAAGIAAPSAPASWGEVEAVKVEKAVLSAGKRIVHAVVHAFVKRSRDESVRITVPIPAGETFETVKADLMQAGREATPQSTVRVKPAVMEDPAAGTWKEADPDVATHVSFIAGPKVGASAKPSETPTDPPATVAADAMAAVEKDEKADAAT